MIRRLLTRFRFTGPELLAALIAVAVALLGTACRERDRGPVVIVDPGPPFPKGRPAVRAVHVLRDGSVVLVVHGETAR